MDTDLSLRQSLLDPKKMLSVRESVVLRGDTVTIPVAMRHAEREEGARMHIQRKTSDRGPRPAGFTAQPTGLSIAFGRFRDDFRMPIFDTRWVLIRPRLAFVHFCWVFIPYRPMHCTWARVILTNRSGWHPRFTSPRRRRRRGPYFFSLRP